MGTDGQQRSKWTVMLYMAASKDPRTEQAAIRDLRELEKVGTTKNVNVIVQIDRDWPGYGERYCVRKGFSEFCEPLPRDQRNIPSGTPEERERRRTDGGEPDVLREFVKWSRKKFRAERYLLVLWGHSYGLGFGRDHGDALTLGELASALRRLDGEDRKAVDILGANACAMSYAEAAFQLQDAADVFVGPEITMPFTGWPYERVLNAIDAQPEIESKDLGKRIVQEFMLSYETALEPQSVALTVLDLKKAGNIEQPLTQLTTALTEAIASSSAIRDDIADAFLQTAHGDVRPLIDLADLCQKLADIDRGDATNVKADAMRLQSFLEEKNGFIVEHRAGRDLEGLHGVGIFAPSVTGAADLMRLELSKKDYDKLTLATKTRWATLAYEGLKDLLDPINKAAAAFVNGTGATGREDRTGVAQLLVGIHQSFLKLDKTVLDVQAKVMKALETNGTPKPLTSTRPEHSAVAARFGPPFLRLAADVRQVQHTEIAVVSGGRIAAGAADVSQPDGELLKSAADSLARLEGAVSNVERTAKRVMTHASLGLGDSGDPSGKPGLGADPGGKPGLGADPGGKPGLGADPGGKPGLGGDSGDPSGKPGLGILPSFIRADRGYVSARNGGSTIAERYAEVAWSLQLIEGAVARLENVLQTIVTGPSDSSHNEPDYRVRVIEQVMSSFRELNEVSTNAKRTAFGVLADSNYGLGPTRQGGLGGPDRRQLATVGGLSSRVLRLL